MKPEIFDDHKCLLGEGPLWHPLRDELHWVDIERNTLLSKGSGATHRRTLDRTPSALAWIDQDRMLVATDRALEILDLRTEALSTLCSLEADDPSRRPNDGRADPWGGFWISTMTRDMAKGESRIYRWYRGELRVVVDGLHCPNAICFSPNQPVGYFADSVPAQIFQHDLDPNTGWPLASPTPFATVKGGGPDGAMTDAEGHLWNAEWGSGRLTCYAPDGQITQRFDFPASQLTCPAVDPKTGRMIVTSAAVGLEKAGPHDGQTFVLDLDVKAKPEPAVVLASA